jgi:DNA-binding XRE family transcriptional regulator
MTEDQLKRAIGDRLRQAREALGYENMAEFARMHDLTRDKLNHWEKGRYYPDPLFITRLWDRHRITADWIYLGVIAGLPHSLGENLLAAPGGAGAAPKEGSRRAPEKA